MLVLSEAALGIVNDCVVPTCVYYYGHEYRRKRLSTGRLTQWLGAYRAAPKLPGLLI